MDGKLFVVSAPSGAGKTSLVSALIERLGKEYLLERCVTYTTRQLRAGEVHGKDYYFISEREFEQKKNENFFLEWSGAYGAQYGSPRSLIAKLKEGVSLILILDRQGAQEVALQVKNSVLIWLDVHDMKTLEERLISRATDSLAEREFRLELARQERQEEQKSGFFTYSIINEKFEKALSDLEMLVSQELAHFFLAKRDFKKV